MLRGFDYSAPPVNVEDLKLENPALKRILDQFDAASELNSYIRYDHYRAYDHSAPTIDQPETWAISEFRDGGGYVMTEQTALRYRQAMRHEIFAIIAAMFTSLFLGWFFSLSPIFSLMWCVVVFMVAVVVWGFLLQRRRQQVSESYIWIKFPDELARAMVVIDRIRDSKNAG